LTPVGEAALYLAGLGWRVFTCWSTKKPAVDDFPTNATTNPAQIHKLWGTRGQWLIGVATGRDSGFWVLDVDGAQGRSTLRKLVEANGPLPPTVTAVTGDDGHHLYFAHPADGSEVHNMQNRDDLPGLDARGWHGYVIAPPSRHPNGNHYRWVTGKAPGEIELALAPDWLLQIVLKRSRGASRSGRTVRSADIPSMPNNWPELMARPRHEASHRGSFVARVYGHFLRKYCDPGIAFVAVEALDLQRCDPPLGRREVTRICADIFDREIARRNGDDTLPDWEVDPEPPAAPSEWRLALEREHEVEAREDFVRRLFAYFDRKYVDQFIAVAAVEAVNLKICKPPLESETVKSICADFADRLAEWRDNA
jgi:hypothetical protein